MAARSKARKRALDILFEAEQRGLSALPLLRDRLPVADPPISEYAVSLIEGVVAHQARIDELLSSYAIDWTLDRMPPVDRAVLRIAVFELLWVDDVPDAVVVSEAVELATALSTDESPRFINGMLGRMSDDKPLLVAPVAGPDEA
ncbi:MAG: transcription antitermination protein NusB [Frankiaceae bacterium]|nr:transcription antitermination protein NusB [Frankiaceae bacterium]